MAERGDKDLRNIRLANYYQDVEKCIFSNFPQFEDGEFIQVHVAMTMSSTGTVFSVTVNDRVDSFSKGGANVDDLLKENISKLKETYYGPANSSSE